MADGEQLKYGWIMGGKSAVPVAIAASQTVMAASGRFVYMNDGAATLNEDGSTSIFGFLEYQGSTTAVTTGTIINCIIDLNAIFRIPINSGTYAVGMVGDYCDISISSNIQGAQLDASVENTLIIVNGDADNNNWVDVRMNPAVWGTALGADA